VLIAGDPFITQIIRDAIELYPAETPLRFEISIKVCAHLKQ